MNFPVGVIYIWTSTNATIPSGWERVTSLDGRYPKGTANATNPNGTGGASTHTHTSTASHTHTMGAHTHTLTIGTGSGGGVNSQSGDQYTIIYNHTHASVTSGSITSASIQSVTPTWAAYSNDPPYYTVIFITPSEAQTYFPNTGVYLYDGVDSKTGHYLCNGSNSTPNLVDKFLKGASTGADAGGTGGTTTNVHIVTHTHTQTHTHSAVTVPASSSSGTKQGSVDPNTLPLKTHTHSASPSANTTGLAGTTSFTTTETVEPAYKKLLTVQNRAGNDVRAGMIGMWLGTLADIPSNYSLCDGTNGTQDMRGKHLKSTSTTGSIGSTGGSNTHTHTAQSHNHGGTLAHTHIGSLTHPGQTGRDRDAGALMATTATTHSISANSQSPTISSTNIAASSSSNEPAYRTVAFIKLTAWEIGEEETVTVSETLNPTLVSNPTVSDTITVSEYLDETIRDGLQISIWKENITVTDIPEFPGPRDFHPLDTLTVSEKVTVKITNDVNEGHKPGFTAENKKTRGNVREDKIRFKVDYL